MQDRSNVGTSKVPESKVSLRGPGRVETILGVNYGEDGSQDFCNRNVY